MNFLHCLCVCVSIHSTLTDQIVPRIYGGEELRTNTHKYLVKLVKKYDNHVLSICSGSIITHQWIISSAHCFPDNVTFVEVQKPGIPGSPKIATLKTSQIIIYPGYTPFLRAYSNYEKDLALLKTTRRIKFNDYVQPISLPSSSVAIGQEVTIAGYGISEEGFSGPREGNTVVSSCKFFVINNFICTYDTVKAGSGDSGGPMVSSNELVGVISSSCKNVETEEYCVTVSVNVFLNLDWIEKVMSSY